MNLGNTLPEKVHIIPATYKVVELIAIKKKRRGIPAFFLTTVFSSLQ